MKLFAVRIERVVMVVAESDQQAQRVALTNEREEISNDPDFIDARPVTTLDQVPPEWRDCFPYGTKEYVTCEKILAGETK